MQTIQEILKKSIEFLSQKGIENSRRQAEEVIADALGIKRLQLYLEFERPLIGSELEKCRSLILRRAKGEPVQYLRGNVEFLGCKMQLCRDVLIPRQETEILADKIIQFLQKEGDLTGRQLWDMCCGSGCIGIVIKKRFPPLDVVLSDISAEALAMAKQNCAANHVETKLVQGDLFTPFFGKKTDYFVCNPPYISEEEYLHLDREVKAYEPKLALTAGENGMEYYRKISEQLPAFLRPSGKAWLEIGASQGSQIEALFLLQFG